MEDSDASVAPAKGKKKVAAPAKKAPAKKSAAASKKLVSTFCLGPCMIRKDEDIDIDDAQFVEEDDSDEESDDDAMEIIEAPKKKAPA